MRPDNTKPSHKVAEKLHTIKRFKERLGITLTEKEYFDLSAKCNDRSFAKLEGYTEDYQQVLRMKYGGFSFRVIFNQLRNRIVTVLPDGIFRRDL